MTDEERQRQEFKEKIQSLGFRRGPAAPKTTVDVHDHHKVEVTEHWNDRVDVTVKPETAHGGTISHQQLERLRANVSNSDG